MRPADGADRQRLADRLVAASLRQPAVTDVTAGSDLLAPALFDHGDAFDPRIAILVSGDFVASGAAGRLVAGARAWFRHDESGEPMERAGVVHLVRGDRVVETVPSHRGTGLAR